MASCAEPGGSGSSAVLDSLLLRDRRGPATPRRRSHQGGCGHGGPLRRPDDPLVPIWLDYAVRRGGRAADGRPGLRAARAAQAPGGTNALGRSGRERAVLWSPAMSSKGAVPVLVPAALTGAPPSRSCAGLPRCSVRRARSSWASTVAAAVGTGVGTMLVIQPWAVAARHAVFILVILLTRYVSLGSLLGSAERWSCSSSRGSCSRERGQSRWPTRCTRPSVRAGLARARGQHRPARPRHGAQVRPRAARPGRHTAGTGS